MYLQRAITKLFVSAMMMGLPELLKMSTEVMGTPQATAAQPGSIGALSANLTASMSQMTDLMSAMGYLVGIMLAVTAMLDFKRHAEEGGSYHNEKVKEPVKKEVKVNLEKKVEEAPKEPVASPLVDFKKRVQESIGNAIPKKEEVPFDFKNAELNALVKEILGKVAYLKGHAYIKKDMESALMVEKTESDYLHKIHKNYMDIPENKRGKKGMENSPYDSTFKQLSLLITGLDEIENKIVKDSVMKQKANEIFLKEKVANM